MANHFASRRRVTSLSVAAIGAIAIIALAFHFYLPGRERALVMPSVAIRSVSLQTVPLYGLIEIDLNVTANFRNPFSPDEVNVTGVFTTPNGHVLNVPAFYYQEYSRALESNKEQLTEVGRPYWKVRFTPTEIGKYTFHAQLENEQKKATTPDVYFTVSPSQRSRGFVRLSGKDWRYFRFDDNTSLILIGHNVCWFGSNGTYDYDAWFSSMSLNKEKITRIWMAPWAMSIEWKTLGEYDMAEAWRLDYVLRLAEEKDIYVLLCFMNHGQLQAGGMTSQWRNNPYNSANGGPVSRPEDFFKSEDAVKLFKKRLAYIVARWGYNTHVLAWELWNEVELTDKYDFGAVAEWHGDVVQYLRQIDPYNHLITTSSDPRFGSLNSVNLLTVHRYGPSGFLDIAGALHSWTRDLLTRYGKPTLVSEFGADWRWFDDPYTTKDKDGVQIHNGIWSSVLSGSACSAMLWWWDNYIHPFDLYYHFRALSRFLEGVQPDREGFKNLEVGIIPPEEIDPKDLCDLTVYPSLGWARPRASQFEVDLYGNVTNLSEFSAFVQGQYHPELRNNPTFIINLTYGGEAVVHVNSVANSGAVMQIYIDGSLAKTVSLADKDGKNADHVNEYNVDVKVTIPPGKHQIRIDNSGNDWFTIDSLKVTGAVLSISKTRVIGLSNGTFALVWIQNKDNTWWNAVNNVTIGAPKDVSLVLQGFQNGEYVVEWWSTYTGEVTGRETVRVTDGTLLLHVERLEKDIAVKAYLGR